MAFIDVVKWEGNEREFAWKFPSENLRLGTQLVVKPGQSAFFVKGGVICDEVTEGTVTLKSGNIPLLTKLISLPFGGTTPFQAEVWFVNRLAKLDTPWGTEQPIQLEDPKYGVIVPVRAFGQFGYRIIDPRRFLETIVGTAKVFTGQQILSYFKGAMLSAVNTSIGNALVEQKVSLLGIAAHLGELSQFCQQSMDETFQRFGLELVNFYFQSINIPESDPSYMKLKQIKEKSAELELVGRDIYQFDKSMDVLKTAAANEGAGSTIMQSGMGLGMGMLMGTQIGQQAGTMLTQVPQAGAGGPPPVPQAQAMHFHVVVDGQTTGPFPIVVLQQMVATGVLSANTLVWRQGMAGWSAAGTALELAALFNPATPPPIPPTV